MTEDSANQPISWIESVLRRPGMYTISGTVFEVYAFIEGYMSGQALCKLDDPRVVEWTEFCIWLSEKTGAMGRDVFSRILTEAGGDKTAFLRLIEDYKAFQKSRHQETER